MKHKSPLLFIPGIGKSIAEDLNNIGIFEVRDLLGKDAQKLFDASNKYEGCIQDRCLLYTFRCAVYYANTPKHLQKPEKLKWWNYKD